VKTSEATLSPSHPLQSSVRCAPARAVRYGIWRALLLFVSCASMVAHANPFYIKKATWHETMLASHDAIAQSGLEDGFAAIETETFRGGDAPREIRVDLSGATELYLFVTGIPNVTWGKANWAGARLIDADGNATPITEVKGFKPLLGRHERDLTLRAGLYQKMRMGGREFERGAQVQANSVLLVPLQGEFVRFESWIGLDDWTGTNGTVRFSVAGSRTAAKKRLWEWVGRDFPEALPRQQMRWERGDRIHEKERADGDLKALALDYARSSRRVPVLARRADGLASSVSDSAGLDEVRNLYYRSRELGSAVEQAKQFDYTALRMAIEDLTETYHAQYPRGAEFLTRFESLQHSLEGELANFNSNDLLQFERIAESVAQLHSLKREALLANPLLDFEELLVIKRKPLGEPRRSQWEDRGLAEYIGLPRQSSWGHGTMTKLDQWENEIAALSSVRSNGTLRTLYKPPQPRLLTDIDLHFNADKMLFSMPDDRMRWQVFEMRADGSGLRQLTPKDQPDVHSYDSCYLPDGRILFISTAPKQGVPCNAGVIVGMMYQMDADGQNIRQICFEQDHDYNPSVLNDGRVIYLRWDYTDTPHIWNRILMSMNPDGTAQMEYYGANSYWPNAIFFPRAIPGHPSKIAGIVTGHHEGRVGELIIFDPAKGRHEASGVVQRVPGRGQKVEPLIEDKLVEHSWPKMVHPWPLSEKYFLVSAKPGQDSLWGIYLVDVFDNMVLLKEEEYFALLEPIPLRPAPTPPIIPNRAQPDRDDALVYMENVHEGPGIKDVPHGTIKSLRLFTYHFGFQTLAGIDHRVGADGPWESKRVLGTVPVDADGSAWFRVPARTPISVQPLDQDGQAVALMRSWMTAMPGENLSCVGCHENKSTVPLSQRKTLAFAKEPSEIAPWRGPVRGFSFSREVQPVLDRSCAGCHDGKAGQPLPDLRRDQGGYIVYEHGRVDGKFLPAASKQELVGKFSGVFDPSYTALRQFIRVGGLESDLHILPPMEFHANTSELVQMLRKGHYNVQLDEEAWDRIITWIDLNAPNHGTWAETTRVPPGQRERRLELRKLYGGVVEDCEEMPEKTEPQQIQPVMPEPLRQLPVAQIKLEGWPFDSREALARQSAAQPVTRKIDLGGGLAIEFVRIPAGSFIMGDPDGELDERPVAVVEIKEPFWMSRHEISNEQFARFNPSHDSRFEHRSSWIFSEEYLGWPLNQPQQPVVRVSWNESMAFARWLAEKLGEEVSLPTEAQWEYACRAGAGTPLSFGDLDTDFSRHANMGDLSLRKLATEGWRPRAPDLVAREERFDDGALVTAPIGSYLPNAWGLHDMHGNVAEWTRTAYRPYPYEVGDGRDSLMAEGDKVVRGGSWRDRPKRCRSAFRLNYPPYQKVFNVGFRLVIEDSVVLAAGK
jgi:formylglycine-generating enzyme required for sulfatase activity